MKTLKPRFFVVVLLLVFFLYKALEVFIFEAHNKTNAMGLPQYFQCAVLIAVRASSRKV